MSQNRGFTRGFVAIERFLLLMIYSKKIGTKRLCCNSEVVSIGRSTVCLSSKKKKEKYSIFHFTDMNLSCWA